MKIETRTSAAVRVRPDHADRADERACHVGGHMPSRELVLRSASSGETSSPAAMLPMGGDPPSRGIASDPVFPEELEDAPGRVPPGQQPVAGTSRWSAQPMIGRAHPFDCQRPCLDSFQNVRKGTDVVARRVDPDEAALMVLRAAGLRVTCLLYTSDAADEG